MTAAQARVPSPARARRWRRLRYAVAACLGLAAPVAASSWQHARLRRDIAAPLAARLGQPVHLQDLRVDAFGDVALTGVEIGAVLTIARVQVGTAWGSALGTNDAPLDLTLTQPRLFGDITALRAAMRRDDRLEDGASRGRRLPPVRLHIVDGELDVRDHGWRARARAITAGPTEGGTRVAALAIEVETDLGTARFERGAIELPARTSPRRAVEDAATRALFTGGQATVRGEVPLEATTLIAGLAHGVAGPRLWLAGSVRDLEGVARPARAVVELRSRQVRFDGGPIPLAVFGQWLPAWVDLGQATFAGAATATPSPAATLVALDGTLADATIAHRALAPAPVPIALDGQLSAWTDRVGLEVAARGSMWQVPLTLDVQLAAAGRQGTVAVSTPSLACQQWLDALPLVSRTASAGLSLGGRTQLAIAGRWDDASAELVPSLGLGACDVHGEAPGGDPRQLRGWWRHRFPDGSERVVGPLRARAPSQLPRAAWVPLTEIPAHLPAAFVAAEDAKFYRHDGFDVEQLARSLRMDAAAGAFVRGGSTITQQLVKNVFLSHRRDLARKLEEAILTWRVEATLSKREILEAYLNIVEFAPGVFGVEAAASYWFGKPVRALTLGECAFLAALAPEPRSMTRRIAAANQLDPVSRDRWALILRAMRRGGADPAHITRAERDGLRLVGPLAAGVEPGPEIRRP